MTYPPPSTTTSTQTTSRRSRTHDSERAHPVTTSKVVTDPAAVFSESLSYEEMNAAKKHPGTNPRDRRAHISFLDEEDLDEKDRLDDETKQNKKPKSMPRRTLSGVGNILGFCAYLLFFSCVLSGEAPKKQQQQQQQQRRKQKQQRCRTGGCKAHPEYKTVPVARRREGFQGLGRAGMDVIVEGVENEEEQLIETEGKEKL
ncbi:hypothetical protein RUND412_003718 [Rhizina undulata]